MCMIGSQRFVMYSYVVIRKHQRKDVTILRMCVQVLYYIKNLFSYFMNKKCKLFLPVHIGDCFNATFPRTSLIGRFCILSHFKPHNLNQLKRNYSCRMIISMSVQKNKCKKLSSVLNKPLLIFNTSKGTRTEVR